MVASEEVAVLASSMELKYYSNTPSDREKRVASPKDVIWTTNNQVRDVNFQTKMRAAKIHHFHQNDDTEHNERNKYRPAERKQNL